MREFYRLLERIKVTANRRLLLGILPFLALGLISLAYIWTFQQSQDKIDSPTEKNAAQIEWIWNDVGKGIQIAKAENKPVLIDFWASWCHWCMKMDEEVLSDKEVVAFVSQNFVPVKIDSDLEQNSKLLRLYSVYGTPTFIILDKNSMAIAKAVGYKPKAEFLNFLEPYAKSIGG